MRAVLIVFMIKIVCFERLTYSIYDYLFYSGNTYYKQQNKFGIDNT